MERKVFEIKKTLTVYRNVSADELRYLINNMYLTDTLNVEADGDNFRVDITSEDGSEVIRNWETV